jgi:hypothetical protein
MEVHSKRRQLLCQKTMKTRGTSETSVTAARERKWKAGGTSEKSVTAVSENGRYVWNAGSSGLNGNDGETPHTLHLHRCDHIPTLQPVLTNNVIPLIFKACFNIIISLRSRLTSCLFYSVIPFTITYPYIEPSACWKSNPSQPSWLDKIFSPRCVYMSHTKITCIWNYRCSQKLSFTHQQPFKIRANHREVYCLVDMWHLYQCADSQEQNSTHAVKRQELPRTARYVFVLTVQSTRHCVSPQISTGYFILLNYMSAGCIVILDCFYVLDTLFQWPVCHTGLFISLGFMLLNFWSSGYGEITEVKRQK